MKPDRHQEFNAGGVWEDLVTDFLEMACFLTREQLSHLLRELGRQKIEADKIDVHPTFSVADRMVIICEESQPQECWLYYPNEKRIARLTAEGGL